MNGCVPDGSWICTHRKMNLFWVRIDTALAIAGNSLTILLVGRCSYVYAFMSDLISPDINECNDTSAHNCDPDRGMCINMDGSFTCACRPGYMGEGTIGTCSGKCTIAPFTLMFYMYSYMILSSYCRC